MNFLIKAVVLFVLPTSIAAQTVVTGPTGQVAGQIDGNAFDLPVMCEEAAGWIVARSHDFGASPDPSKVDAAVMVMMPPGPGVSVSALVGGDSYEFGIANLEPGRKLSYDGSISGSDGDYAAQFELDCDTP